MANGLDIVFDDPNPPADLPFADPYDLLRRPGLLVLLDPIHTMAPWAAGVPAHGAVLKNLADDYAAELIGSGDATTLGVTINRTDDATSMKLERTTKGGLHIIHSPTAGVTGKGVAFKLPTLIKNYMIANQGHRFGWCLQSRITRASATTQTYAEFDASNLTQASNYQALMRTTTPLLANGSSIVDPARNTVGDYFEATTFSGVVGTVSSMYANLFQLGSNPTGTSGFASAGVNSGLSMVFQRGMLADLTVMSMDFDDWAAEAKDFATMEHANGGRYYGDTWATNPEDFA